MDGGGFAKALDSEAAAPAEVDEVDVVLEDLLLRHALFELEGDHGFGGFALPGAVAVEEEGPRELHGDGGGAVAAVLGDVDPGGADKADRIEAGVLEEALVLGGEDGVDEDLGDVLELDLAALLAGAVEQIGEEFGFEVVDGALGVVAAGDDAGDDAVAEEDDAGLGARVGVDAGKDLDGVLADMEIAHAVGAGLGVAAAAESGDELIVGEAVADRDGVGGGEKHGRLAERAGLELGVDEVGEMNPEVKEDAANGDHGEGGGAGDELEKQSWTEAAAGGSRSRGFLGMGCHADGCYSGFYCLMAGRQDLRPSSSSSSFQMSSCRLQTSGWAAATWASGVARVPWP